ncbi:cellobiose phosphorylase, partial [Bacillaceae bacterium Marseille-Q3522]|nr:cellobiose phosphorylase [Bacillaceae bacterium Marseille-Q3522]
MDKKNDGKFILEAGNVQFTFLNSGDIFEAKHKSVMINQILANPIDGSMNNLYLRLFLPTGIKVISLLGVKSKSRVRFTSSQVIWKGKEAGVAFQVVFKLTNQGVWFWDVTLEGSPEEEVDLIYGQDIGLADKGAVQSNEAYVAQYLDQVVFQDEKKGYVVCVRQNQPQSGGTFPYLQQGSLTKTIGYSTDGYQFFGKSYKVTNEPESLWKGSLANEVYAYEFTYTALQTERVKLTGTKRFVFYGLFNENHEDAITSLQYQEKVSKAWQYVKDRKIEDSSFQEKVSICEEFGKPLQTLTFDQAEIEELYPRRIQEEYDGTKLLSFFTDKYEHIVLKEKELLVERPHGHILMTGENLFIKEDIITTTSYMYGVFNSQISVGNTSMNKLLTNTRNSLNVMKTSGQRIYVEIDGYYRLLTMPSMFEIGFNYVRWIYKWEKDTFVITNYTKADSPEIHLHFQSVKGKKYRYLVTNQVIMNGNEYELPFHMKKGNRVLSFYPDNQTIAANVYPDLSYLLHVTGTDINIEDEARLVKNALKHSASLVVLELNETSEWTITIQGLINGKEIPTAERTFEEEKELYRKFLKQVLNGFHLSLENNSKKKNEVEKMNIIAWWYTHNMFVHYSVPHGLEQYGGAAWGTRDVCQGPTEYFLATQKFDVVREIIKTVFSHQYQDDGNWPQWFMFDKYFRIQQEESHGDIIVWPLKVLSDYLTITHDFSLLVEKIPYTTRGSYNFTKEKATILEHVKKEMAYIKQHFLHGTYLSSYGDGDWDDTLQPANPQLKKYMVSSWTVALTYQAFKQFSEVLSLVDEKEANELKELALEVARDFKHYMLQDKVIPGFLFMEEADNVKRLLHPTDSTTGIEYRLLPMTRSMIAELLKPEEAEYHFQLIKKNLYFPDGVRLMNRPATYNGGVSTHFKRAEQAANFGREIGLNYIHAHIRFVEAMTKLGKRDEAWKGLITINPIGIRNVVPNAEYRQSNTYFSSSDGKFNTRYEAQERFQELRKGTVSVKGGWRIYSSGPGIYMNQLIINCLGIRQVGGDLVIDPVLPVELDGLTFNFIYNGRTIQYIYHLKHVSERRVTVNSNVMDIEIIKNPYRQGAFRINQQK